MHKVLVVLGFILLFNGLGLGWTLLFKIIPAESYDNAANFAYMSAVCSFIPFYFAALSWPDRATENTNRI